jgi:8-oxo-dGTP diphosphatase
MIAIVVTAAVIERHGTLLVTRRPEGVHLEGYWEFPGGKCEAGESLPACLARELREELAVEARIGEELFATTHAYAERHVELHFFRCELEGEPRPQLGQEMRWVRRDELAALEFPPADAELIQRLTRA